MLDIDDLPLSFTNAENFNPHRCLCPAANVSDLVNTSKTSEKSVKSNVITFTNVYYFSLINALINVY